MLFSFLLVTCVALLATAAFYASKTGSTSDHISVLLGTAAVISGILAVIAKSALTEAPSTTHPARSPLVDVPTGPSSSNSISYPLWLTLSQLAVINCRYKVEGLERWDPEDGGIHRYLIDIKSCQRDLTDHKYNEKSNGGKLEPLYDDAYAALQRLADGLAFLDTNVTTDAEIKIASAILPEVAVKCKAILDQIKSELDRLQYLLDEELLRNPPT